MRQSYSSIEAWSGEWGSSPLHGVAWMTTPSTSLNYAMRAAMTNVSQEKMLQYRELYLRNQRGESKKRIAESLGLSRQEISRRIDVYKRFVAKLGY